MSDELDNLFLKAREILDPGERAAFLDQACNNSPGLRVRVDRLLADEGRAESFFTEAVSEDENPVRTRAVQPAAGDQASEWEGQCIGRYKLVEKVGEGGCGVVFVAEQSEPIRRRVALKVIKLGMDTKEVVARFEIERQALAMMDHPNIAKVLDAGATDTGRPFFVMELVRGIRMTDYCDQNNLGTKERLDLFVKVCQAIQHAHQKGIIHRDIKPSNILVTLHDGVPVPKVIDFGIAKATEGRLTNNTVYTQLHQFLGTPAYMSPEQVEMSGLDIDTRSDIYSLGVLLYELLVGSTPFDTQELMDLGIDAMRQTIREREPVRPSTKLATLKGDDLTATARRRSAEASKLMHQLQGDLDWIVMKCLEKDRTRRYDTANGLAMDIQSHLSCEPVLACPPSKLYEFRKTVRRHKFGFAATTAIILVLAIGVLISTWQARVARVATAGALEAKSEATAKAAAEREAREESEAVTKFLVEVFQSPDPGRGGRTITVAETLDRAAKNLDSDLVAQPALRAKLQATLGATYQTLGLYSESIPLLEKARDHHVAVSGLENVGTLRAKYNLANSYHRVGRLQEALDIREDVLMRFHKLLGSENPSTIKVMQSLADSYAALGRIDEALTMREEALMLFRKVLGSESDNTARAMYNLAISYKAAGKLEKATELCESALKVFRKALGPEHPSTLRAMGALANCYEAANRREEALELREKVVPLFQKVFGRDHSETSLAIKKLNATSWLKLLPNDALAAGDLTAVQWTNLIGTEVVVSSDPSNVCQTGIIIAESDRYRLYPCPTDTWNTSPERWDYVDFRGHIGEGEITKNGRPYMQLCHRIGSGNLEPVHMGDIVTGVGELFLMPSDVEGGGLLANNKGSIRVKIVKVN